MKPLFLTLVLTALFFTMTGCSEDANLCEGTLSQTPPRTVGLILLDKSDGNNIILKNNLNTNDIKVTNGETGKSLQNWRIITTPKDHPVNGALELAISDGTEGDHTINIQVNGIGTVILSYTISKEKNDNPCHPYYYPLTALQVANHTWELFEHEGKPIPNIVVVRIPAK